MISAIISTIIGSFSKILWKKSLPYWLNTELNTLVWYLMGFCIVIYFLFKWINFWSVNIIFVSLVIVFAVLDVISSKFDQLAFREEKISVLMPYTNIHKIIIVIASFFIFRDVSNISFFITLLAILVIILFSIDYKTLRFPKNIITICIAQFARSWSQLIGWWLVIKYWENLLFVFDVTIWAVAMSITAGYAWAFSQIKNIPSDYWVTRLLSWFFSWWSYAISLFLISELGLSLTTLLSFLWIWTTLVMSYFLLKDKPSSKDLILTFVVTLLIWIWFYFS